MNTFALFRDASIVTGCTGPAVAGLGSYHLSWLPARPQDAPLVPMHLVAFSLAVLASLWAEQGPWRVAGHLLAAVLPFGIVLRSAIRARRASRPSGSLATSSPR